MFLQFFTGRNNPITDYTRLILPTSVSDVIGPSAILHNFIKPVIGFDFQEVYLIGSAVRHPGFDYRKKFHFFGRQVKRIKHVVPRDIDILILTNALDEEKKVEFKRSDKIVYYNDSYGCRCYRGGSLHFLFTPITTSYRNYNSLIRSAQRDGYPFIHRGNPTFFSDNLKEEHWTDEWQDRIHLSFKDGSNWEWQ
jgi:hypothetical protein